MLQSVAEGLACLLEPWELKECAGDTREPETGQGENKSQAQECREKEHKELLLIICWALAVSHDAFKVKSSLLRTYPASMKCFWAFLFSTF